MVPTTWQAKSCRSLFRNGQKICHQSLLPEEEGPAGCQSDTIGVPTKTRLSFWSLPQAALPDMDTQDAIISAHWELAVLTHQASLIQDTLDICRIAPIPSEASLNRMVLTGNHLHPVQLGCPSVSKQVKTEGSACSTTCAGCSWSSGVQAQKGCGCTMLRTEQGKVYV